jgi:flagellar protein FliL
MGLRKKKGDSKAAEAEASSSKKSNFLPAIIIAVGLIAGGKMMGGGGGATVPAAAATTTTTIPPEGPVVKLDPITLNLADGRFARVGVAFQMALPEEGEAAVEGEGEAEPDSTDPAGHYAKALDIVIRVLGRGTYEQLVSVDGRKQAKAEVLGELQRAYPEEIEGLYFTEFVLQ